MKVVDELDSCLHVQLAVIPAEARPHLVYPTYYKLSTHSSSLAMPKNGRSAQYFDRVCLNCF